MKIAIFDIYNNYIFTKMVFEFTLNVVIPPLGECTNYVLNNKRIKELLIKFNTQLLKIYLKNKF